MNVNQLAQKFWEEGYLVLESFFSEKMMTRFNNMVLEHFGLNTEWEHSDEFVEKSATEVVPWFPMREGVMDFLEIEDEEKFKDITNQILGEGWDNLYCMAMFSKKGTKGQAWHQDCPPENSAQFNLNRLVYTHDITPEIGGQVIVVPGSHKKGVLPKGNPHEDIEGQVVLTPKKGDVVFLHGHAWHRVLPITGAYRVSTNFRAMPKDTPEEITDIAVYRNMRYQFSTSEVIEER
jgi:hypothetical protein